ncbi:MAG: hypothetical protein M3094_08925 [Actinomycetia bacterium]|nr:hypothetical protein [Actinomycetes bacterium]
MNPFRSRLWRTIILFVAGLGASFAVAEIFTPYWPDLCDSAIVGAPCEIVATQTVAGYLILGLGILTIILGPIAGSLLDLTINGARWETPRGKESIITNTPILLGALYLVLGVVTIAAA